jgi:hypothetical protein
MHALERELSTTPVRRRRAYQLGSRCDGERAGAAHLAPRACLGIRLIFFGMRGECVGNALRVRGGCVGDARRGANLVGRIWWPEATRLEGPLDIPTAMWTPKPSGERDGILSLV